MQRLVLSVLTAAAVVLIPSNRVSAGLWEKFWAKKHAYHNSARGVKHNHYHHLRADKCGTSACKSCKCSSHAYAAPSYPSPVYQPPVYQPQPTYQPSVYQPPVYQQPISVPVTAPAVSWQNVPQSSEKAGTLPITKRRVTHFDWRGQT